LALSPTAAPVDVGDRAIAGDTNSSAVFFLECYFDKIPKQLTNLLPLVVHAVLMAEGDTVRGVQVGIFTRNQFRALTAKEMKPLIRASTGLDSLILRTLKS
jgi:hypothetical protein